MSEPNNDRVTCPNCNKGYRWQPSLVGKRVPCKLCGESFDVPAQPGVGLLPERVQDDGLYELMANPDDEPQPAPAHVVPKVSATETHVPPPVGPAAEAQGISQDPDEEEPSEPTVHLSEAAKASRREAQRIAATQMQSVRSWRDYKWLIIALSLLALFVLIYWAMYLFSNAIDEGLHHTMLYNRHAQVALSDLPSVGKP